MDHPAYEEGRLAAIAVRLAMSSGLAPANARAALELACRMIDDAQAQLDGTTASSRPSHPSHSSLATAQKSEPCPTSGARDRVGLGGGRNFEVSSSKRL